MALARPAPVCHHGRCTPSDTRAGRAAGRVELRALGSTVLQQDYVYYPWTTYKGSGRVQQLKTGTTISPTALQDLRYTYDAGGNVLTILDNKAGGAQTQTFTYDALDRLQTAQASGGTGGTYALETYTYIRSGTSKPSRAWACTPIRPRPRVVWPARRVSTDPRFPIN
jgi:hypothetical protein